MFKCNQEKQITVNEVILACTSSCLHREAEGSGIAEVQKRYLKYRDCLATLTRRASPAQATEAVKFSVLGTLGSISVLLAKAEAHKCWFIHFLSRMLG